MLDNKIIKFVDELKQLNSIGCLTIPATYVNQIQADLSAADQILAATPTENRVTYGFIKPHEAFPPLQKPFLIIVTEEAFSSNSEFADHLRKIASYFLNLK